MNQLLTLFLNNFGLVSNDTVFERINVTQILKQIHSNPYSYGNGVVATRPKNLYPFLLNYFVFKKLLLEFHKNFWFYENLIINHNTKITSAVHKSCKVSILWIAHNCTPKLLKACDYQQGAKFHITRTVPAILFPQEPAYHLLNIVLLKSKIQR